MAPSTDHGNQVSRESGDGTVCKSTKPSKTTSQCSSHREDKKSSSFFIPFTQDQNRSLISSLARHSIGHQLRQIGEADSKFFELCWSGIACDDKLVAEVVNEFSCEKYDYTGTAKEAIAGRHEERPTYSHSTITKIRTQFLEGEMENKQSSFKIGWNFVSYAIKKNRIIHGVKFHVYQKIPFKPGSYVILHNFCQSRNHAHLNGLLATVIEYLETKDKYLIKIGRKMERSDQHNTSNVSEHKLNDSSETDQTIVTAPMMIMHSKNLRLCHPPDEKSTGSLKRKEIRSIRTWKFATLQIAESLRKLR